MKKNEKIKILKSENTKIEKFDFLKNKFIEENKELFTNLYKNYSKQFLLKKEENKVIAYDGFDEYTIYLN